MKKYLISSFSLLAIAVMPMVAFAHGHTGFEINEKVYMFTVGSLNEPIAVDDKTGVDLRIMSMSHQAHEAGEMSGMESLGTPVVGLDKTLKVELLAGTAKKTLDLSPAYNDPGAYRAYFIPTIQTTYGYRVFGTIDNVAFDYTFTCNPAGHPQVPEDKKEVEISKGVMRIESAGAFGCPAARDGLGFPEPATIGRDLSSKNEMLASAVSSASLKGLAGIVLGIISLAVGVGALLKKPKSPVA